MTQLVTVEFAGPVIDPYGPFAQRFAAQLLPGETILTRRDVDQWRARHALLDRRRPRALRRSLEASPPRAAAPADPLVDVTTASPEPASAPQPDPVVDAAAPDPTFAPVTPSEPGGAGLTPARLGELIVAMRQGGSTRAAGELLKISDSRIRQLFGVAKAAGQLPDDVIAMVKRTGRPPAEATP
jgi:hypothetical protein